MKNVLITTDFSDNSKNAMNYAISMFGVKDVNFVVLNTYQDVSTSSTVMVSMVDTYKKDSIRLLGKLEEELLAAYDGIQLETKSMYGSLTRCIGKLSGERIIDYVVLGTKGLTGLENFIMGSNTLEVIKSIKIPLLVIPSHSEYQGLHRIAFAADYDKLENANVLKPMVNLALRTGAEVKIVNVLEEDKAADINKAEQGFVLHGQLEDVRHQYFTEVNDKVIDGLEVFIKEKNIEMIALVAHKYNFFDRLFHRSVTKQVSKLADIPLLVMHD
jgi:nucleotide-binding universal stress UspA family protein